MFPNFFWNATLLRRVVTQPGTCDTIRIALPGAAVVITEHVKVKGFLLLAHVW